jgi:hypothetical protein
MVHLTEKLREPATRPMEHRGRVPALLSRKFTAISLSLSNASPSSGDPSSIQ